MNYNLIPPQKKKKNYNLITNGTVMTSFDLNPKQD